jgi:hypothetical protein
VTEVPEKLEEPYLRAEIKLLHLLNADWQAEAGNLRRVIVEILEVANEAVEQPPAVRRIRVIATDTLRGRGDRVTPE